MAAVGKIAGHRHILGGYFPLCFTWQAFPGPFGKRIGLVKTDVTDGLGRVQPAAACERKDRPFVVVSVPVKRRFPALLVKHRPAVRKPELRLLVAAGLYEAEVLATTDRPGGQAERLKPDLVPRRLIIEGKRRSAVADL